MIYCIVCNDCELNDSCSLQQNNKVETCPECEFSEFYEEEIET